MASTPDNSAYTLIAEAASTIAASAKVLAVQVKLLQRDSLKKNQVRSKTSSKSKTKTAVVEAASDSSDASEPPAVVAGEDGQAVSIPV